MRLTKLAAPAFLFLLMMALPFFAVAQETQPTATPSPTNIPILGEPTDESGAPALEGAPALSTQDGSQGLPSVTPVAPGAETTAEVPVADSPTCPTLVEESFTALEQVCTGLSTGDACIGNGTIEGTSSIDGLQFAQPGDIARVTSFDALNLRTSNTPGTVWSVMTIQLELRSTDGDVPVGVQTILFGNVSITDEGRVGSGGAQDATVIAGRGMNVRREPGTTGVVVWQLQSGEQVIATGRSADREWIRIQIPNRFQGIGWVYAPYLEVEGGADSLPIVNANSPAPELTAPEFGPMQAISLETANFPAECTDIPPSGLLMQTPSGLPDEVRLQVNGAEIIFNGAVFVQATAATALQVYILEGQATVTANGTSANGGSGTFITVTLDAESNATGAPLAAAFEIADFDQLPIRLLDRQFVLSTSEPVQPESNTSSAEGFASPTTASGFGTSAPTATPQVCTLTAPDVRNVRSGPGTDFEIVRVLQAGDSVTGIGQTRDADGFPWYQTNDGFIRLDAVNASGACAELPSVTPPPTEVPAATNTPEGGFLESTTLGAVTCPGGQVSASGTSDGSQLFITLGGEWTIGAGTTATFSTQGGLLRPELGDYIQLVTADGTVIAESNDGRVLTVTFEQQQTFTARFSAANGDVVVMSARCDS
jgi:uncharacterized protein YgiM (DUF1202 family)